MPPREAGRDTDRATVTIGPRARDLWLALLGVLPGLVVVGVATLLGVPAAGAAALGVVAGLAVAAVALRRVGTTIGPDGVVRRDLLKVDRLSWERAQVATVGRWERPGSGGQGMGTGETWLYVTGLDDDGAVAQVPLVSTASLRRLEGSASTAARRGRGLWRSAIDAVEAHGLQVGADPGLAREDLAALARLRQDP